jgi:hypothetical protein
MVEMLSHVNYIKIAIIWLPLALVATMTAGIVYLAVQQDERATANDPQIQMVEDTAYNLQSGSPVTSVISGSQVDPSRSLAPFVIVYDFQGKVVSSQASIIGQIPDLPKGVLDLVKSNGEQRFTWQPQGSTRIAAVVAAYSGSSSGYVLAGRSLREVEVREGKLQSEISMAWLFSLLGSIILIGIFVWIQDRARQHPK